MAGGRAAPLDAAAAAKHFPSAERIADEAARPKRRWLLSRKARRTLRRRAPLLVAGGAVIVVALVAALAIWVFAPSKTPAPTGPKTMTAGQIAAKYGPSVVRITTPTLPADATATGKPGVMSGSGFVASKDGWIITSLAVVQGKGMSAPLSVKVEYALPTGEYRKTTGIVTDHVEDTGIAIVKVDPQNMDVEPVPIGDSDSIVSGQRVVALGLQPTMTTQFATGSVTSVSMMHDALSGNQHAAWLTDDLERRGAIAGDALAVVGGPIFNESGRVVAIVGPLGVGNTSVWDYEGDITKQAVAIYWAVTQIAYDGQRGWPRSGTPNLGIRYEWLTSELAAKLGEHQGALVQEVAIGSAAHEAGIVAGSSLSDVTNQLGSGYRVGGDVVVAIDGVRLTKAGQLSAALGRHKAGDTVALRLWRGDRLITVKAEMGVVP
jgi:S1-C subfamily serine protease